MRTGNRHFRPVIVVVLLAVLVGSAVPAVAQSTATYAFVHRIYQHFPDGSSANANGVDVIEIPSGERAARLDLPGQMGFWTEPFKSPDERAVYLVRDTNLGRIDTRTLEFTLAPIAGATRLLRGFVSADSRTLYLVEPDRILHVDARTFDVLRTVELPVSALIEELQFMPLGANVQLSSDRTTLYVLGIPGDWYYAIWMAAIDVHTGALLGRTPTVPLMTARWLTGFSVLPDGSAAFVSNLWDPTRWVDLASFSWLTDRPVLPYVSNVEYLDQRRAFFGYEGGQGSPDSCSIFDAVAGIRERRLPCNALSGSIKGALTSDGRYLAMLNAAHPRWWQPVMFFDTETWAPQWSSTYWFDSSYDGWIVTATVALDELPPAFSQLPGPVSVEATGPSGATYTYELPSAIDETDGPVPVVCTPASGSLFSLGSTTVDCTAGDRAGNQARVSFVVTVRDTTPPVVAAAADAPVLWPPNGKMRPIRIAGSVIDGVSAVKATGTFKVADEYGMVQPVGEFAIPADGLWAFTVNLEASRRGQDSDGRVYAVSVGVMDGCGNAGGVVLLVTVPHDQRR